MDIESLLEKLLNFSKNIDDKLAVPLIWKKYKDPFRVLITVVLSIRSKEEVTIKAAERLFEKYKTIDDFIKSNEKEIEETISFLGLKQNKAKWIKEIAKRWKDYCISNKKKDNCMICDEEFLLSLPGVGRKVMNVYLNTVCNKDVIAVDTHVHRVFNRLGIVNTKYPDETEQELYKIIPKKYWRAINENLVKFGRNVCLPKNPRCKICPVKNYCKYYKKVISDRS